MRTVVDTKGTFKIAGKRIMLLIDTNAGRAGRRVSLRMRSLSRPNQINITVTRFKRSERESWQP